MCIYIYTHKYTHTHTHTHMVGALTSDFSATRIEEFRLFVQDGRSYEKLVQAFAPSIW